MLRPCVDPRSCLLGGFLVVYRTHQLAGFVWLRHGRHVFDGDGLQRSMQIDHWAAFAAPCLNPLPDHLTRGLAAQGVCGLQRSSFFHFAENPQQQGCSDGRQWQ
jgi:hypothetical protein